MRITFPTKTAGGWDAALQARLDLQQRNVPLFLLAEGSYPNPNYPGSGPGVYTKGTGRYVLSDRRTGEQVLLDARS